LIQQLAMDGVGRDLMRSRAPGDRDHCAASPPTRSRLLLVDHDDATAELHLWMQHRAAVEMTRTRSGYEGVAAARDDRFDLMLLEWNLPDIPGAEVVRRVREAGVSLPFIIVASHVTVAGVVEAMKLGAVTVMEKPLDSGTLLRAVQGVTVRRLKHEPRAPFDVEVVAIRAREGARLPLGIPQRMRSTTERWAWLVLAVVNAEYDPRTLDDWAQAACVSRSVLCECCRLVRISPHDARDFARIVRAICRSPERWQPETVMDIADARTLKKLLQCAGLVGASKRPSLEEYLDRQRWIPRDNPALIALRQLLRGEI
jgi:ActR/RegA family two-component response regulator